MSTHESDEYEHELYYISVCDRVESPEDGVDNDDTGGADDAHTV